MDDTRYRLVTLQRRVKDAGMILDYVAVHGCEEEDICEVTDVVLAVSRLLFALAEPSEPPEPEMQGEQRK